MPILETQNLTHIYSAGTPFEHAAISDINFTAERGEYIGIAGATGSGKSTLIQHLNGLLKPTSGKVLYYGADIHEEKQRTLEIRFKVGLVFQYPEYQLFDTTVAEDIAFGPKNMGLTEQEVSERVNEAADFVRLDKALLKKSPFELSGGQKRRAAIAGVIAMRPEVLILDEPTAGLDPKGQKEIIRNIASYRDTRGATIILVTHNMNEIARSVERMIVLQGGNLSMSGTPAEVFSQTDRLSEQDLLAPKASQLADKLRKLGVPLDNNIYTIKQLHASLVELRDKGGAGSA